jgi:hypothetical protein
VERLLRSCGKLRLVIQGDGLKIHHLCNGQKILFLIMTYHYHMVSIIIAHSSVIWKAFQIFKFEKKPKSLIIMLYVCYFYLLDLVQLISLVFIIYYKRYHVKIFWKLITWIHFLYTNMKIQTLIILVVEHVIVIMHLVKSLVVQFFKFWKGLISILFDKNLGVDLIRVLLDS